MKRKDYINQTANKFYDNPEFIEDIKSIRGQIEHFPLEGFTSLELMEQWKEENIYMKINASVPIDNAVTNLLIKYRLGPGWFESVKRFLYLNENKDPRLPTELQAWIKRDEQTGLPQIAILLPHDVTLEEIKKLYQEEIKGLKQKLSVFYSRTKKKKQPTNYSQRNKLASEMRDNKKTYDDISKKLSDLGYGIATPEQIKEYVKSYRKQRGIN